MKKITGFFFALLLLFQLGACGQNTLTWEEQYDLGIRYLSEGNYEEAIIAFTAAIEIDPNRAEAYVGRGDAYIGSGETEDNLTAALADYEAAIALDETMPTAWLGLADVYIRQGDYDKALEVLKEALKKTGSDQSIVDKIAEIKGGELTDSSGNVRRKNCYDDSGALIWYHTYTYDDQSRISSVTSYDAAGKQTGDVDIAYDDNGNQLNSHQYLFDDGKVYNGINYKYDINGRLTRLDYLERSGEIEEYRIYSYNVDNSVDEVAMHFGNGTYRGVKEYQYDAAGRLVRIDQLDETGNINSYHLFEYDTEGRLAKQSLYYTNLGLDSYVTYTYTKANELEATKHYDAQGNLEYIERSSSAIDAEMLVEAIRQS